MELVNGEFRVVRGERVTIQITPSVNLGNQFVGSVFNDSTLNPFDFVANKTVGDKYAVKIVFGFIGAPNGSRYDIRINGNGANNKGPFNRQVEKGDLNERIFVFKVV